MEIPSSDENRIEFDDYRMGCSCHIATTRGIGRNRVIAGGQIGGVGGIPSEGISGGVGGIASAGSVADQGGCSVDCAEKLKAGNVSCRCAI